MQIKSCTANVRVVRELSDEPALTPTELKLAFDKGAENIKDWINSELVPSVNEELSAKEEKITGAAQSVVSENLPGDFALVSSPEGKIASCEITKEEILCLKGVSGSIKEALEGKQNKISFGTSLPDEAGEGEIFILIS